MLPRCRWSTAPSTTAWGRRRAACWPAGTGACGSGPRLPPPMPSSTRRPAWRKRPASTPHGRAAAGVSRPPLGMDGQVRRDRGGAGRPARRQHLVPLAGCVVARPAKTGATCRNGMGDGLRAGTGPQPPGRGVQPIPSWPCPAPGLVPAHQVQPKFSPSSAQVQPKFSPSSAQVQQRDRRHAPRPPSISPGTKALLRFLGAVNLSAGQFARCGELGSRAG